MIIRCVQMVPVRGFQRELSKPDVNYDQTFSFGLKATINALGFPAKALFRKVFQLRFTCARHTLRLGYIF